MKSGAENFVQCSFVNRASHGSYTAWIPQAKAIMGKVLKLKINGKWENQLEVTDVGTIKDASYLKFKQEVNKSFGQSIK